MSTDHPQTTADLARFALETPFRTMPDLVRREGIRSLVNIVGCTLGGAHHDAVEKTWSALSPFAGREQATLLGRAERTDALTASLINTLSSSVYTFDDTHAEAIVHPSGPIMGATLAAAEMHTVSGADLLAAFIIGVEASCRLSKSVSVAPAKGSIAWSQTGIACGIGAALASSRLLGLDLDQTRMAIGIAAAEASGIRALHGTHCTPMMPANAGCLHGLRRSDEFQNDDGGALRVRRVLCRNPASGVRHRRPRRALGNPRQHLQALSVRYCHPSLDRRGPCDCRGGETRTRLDHESRYSIQSRGDGALLPPPPQG
jgi:hypothetical protein